MNTTNNSQFKLRFGVIGTSNIAHKVMTGAKEDPRFEMVAICSRTQDQADIFAQKHGLKHTFTSLEEMAQSPLIDAVYIASPNSLHAAQSILFMQHGKHVLCEKPFASNAKETKEMIAASEKYNVTLMEAMKPTFTPNFLIMRDHLKELGTIRRYFACYCQYSSRYDDLKAGIVRNAFDPSLSNGATVDIGVYTIYPMVVLFGRPNKISATGIKLSTGVDGQGAINFEYDGMNATVLYSKIVNSGLRSEIQGEDATMSTNYINIIEDVKLTYRADGTEKTISKARDKHEYFYEVEEFINLVQAGKRQSEVNSHQTSLIVMEILDEIRRQIGVEFPADKG